MPNSVFLRSLLTFFAITLIIQPLLGQEDETAPIVSPAPAQPTPAATSSTAPSVASATPPAAATPMQLTEVLGKGLKARSIGPAVMGGRVSDIAIDPRNPAVFYVGLATGGLFKTANNGVSFDFRQAIRALDRCGCGRVGGFGCNLGWHGRRERS